MTVDPTPETIKQFIAEDDGEPIVMLNLLNFDGEAGRKLYAEYSAKVMAHLERVGGQPLYFGVGQSTLIEGAGKDWDAVALVRYPSRSAFLEMVMDPEYQEISKLRSAALSDAVLQPTTAWTGA